MKIKDKTFQIFIPSNELAKRVKELGSQVNTEYAGKRPLFIAILNGSFMFASDLMKAIDIPSEISFVKVASYQEMESTGNVKQLIGLSENIFNQHVIIIEDIIDTGRTMHKILEEFNALGASSVEIISLLRKPKPNAFDIPVKYIGFDIPDKFVVGYGLDYDGLGRNLQEIYQLKDD